MYPNTWINWTGFVVHQQIKIQNILYFRQSVSLFRLVKSRQTFATT